MKYLIKILLFFFLFIKMLCDSLMVSAQEYSCCLYGTITTVNGDVYEGPIRWNDEELFLSDFFNSEKESNPYLKYIPSQTSNLSQFNRWEKGRSEFNISRYGNYGERDGKFDRKFQCRFGDIKSIVVTAPESVCLELKSDKFINLTGGSNDVGTQIWIIDKELGLFKLDWDRIDVIKFSPTPKDNKEKFGIPIYGKLTTTKGEFIGFIQWDHDERILSDQLDGRGRDGELSIPFEKIKSIQKNEDGCLVVLQSERTIELKEKNDVTKENRGVFVSIPKIGQIDFPWEYFLSLELLPFPDEASNCYAEFPDSQRLKGKVITIKGDVFDGIIVYDLDEAMDAEILNGLNDKLEFSIPFRNIRYIQPKSNDYCLVELKNGEKLYLGDQTDVSDRNNGLLIFDQNGKYQYVRWMDIDRIEF